MTSLRPAETHRTAAVLLARSAIAATPLREMEALATKLSAQSTVDVVAFAFTEQGTPTLYDVLHHFRDKGFGEVLVLPFMLPMEPSLGIWISRVVQRWQGTHPDDWPVVRVGPSPAEGAAIDLVLRELIETAANSAPVASPAKRVLEASLVPAQKRRILICQGGPCNNAGAFALWAHLRSEQDRLNLRKRSGGTMSTKSSCLGPCNLAPVVQVYPEGVYYGGVDKNGLDCIINQHLIDGRLVKDLAYEPDGTKQVLRVAKS